MATKKHTNNLDSLNSLNSFSGSFGYKEVSKPIPDSYKVGRDAQLQLAKVERDLFTDMEEKESGNYIISGLSRQISEQDFTAFSFAIGQILYNQSYQSGNTDTNSGLAKKEAKNISKKVGSTQYSGEIVTSLNDLCRLAYGVEAPDIKQRKKMEAIIDIIDSTPVTIQYPNGNYLKSWLCRKLNERYTAENGAIYYNFTLNPIFCSNVKSNFGELPQDIIKRLSGVTTKKTQAHYLLIRLLSIQTKKKPFIRTLEELLKDLKLYEAYKKDRGRTEKQLLSTFKAMVDINLLECYEIDYVTIRAKKAISKVTFHLATRGKLLGKESEETEEPEQAEEK